MQPNGETGYSSLCRMNSILIYALLGLTTCVVQPARPKGSPKANLSVWPPGSSVYLGESVAMRCSCRGAQGAARLVWTYRWFKHQPHAALISRPGHLVFGDSYSITVVTREDGGSYWCRVEGTGDNNTTGDNSTTTTTLLSNPAELTVSEVSLPLLTVTPSTRQLFPGRRFTVRCPAMSERNATGWILKQLTGDFRVRTMDLKSGLCSPLEGTNSEAVPGGCIFPNTNRGNSGLYWCECPEGSCRRSNAVNITVSYGDMIIMSPAHAVLEGDPVVLYCEYRNSTGRKTILIKDGVEVQSSYSSKKVVEMPVDNVTSADEGFYKCASPDRKMESPESWLSVRNNSTSMDRISDDSTWKWMVLSCCIVGLLFFLPLIGLLGHRYRHRMWGTRSCWPLSKEDPAHVDPPKTTQDVTEVQWDLPWMEMSNLLDKQVYSGSEKPSQ